MNHTVFYQLAQFGRSDARGNGFAQMGSQPGAQVCKRQSGHQATHEVSLRRVQ